MPFSLPSRVTLAEAPALLALGAAYLRDGDGEFDLGAVAECDSSVLACVNEWRRQSAALGRGPVRVTNVPESIRRIARLYGVESLTLA